MDTPDLTVERHSTMAELQAGLAAVGASPANHGTLDMIAYRPTANKRVVVESAELSLEEGVVGDNWSTRGSRHTPDGKANPDAQIAIMNSRIVQLVAHDRSRWALAGDQLFIDLDLSPDNLPSGQRLAVGTAILEITATPHTGCDKFTARYGSDAIRFVNGKEGRPARRRGIYARVVQPGTIRAGDTVSKL